MKLELTTEFAKHLRTGDHLKQDETGFYVSYDTVEIDLDNGGVRFVQAGRVIIFMQVAFSRMNTLSLTGLDGRFRLTLE